MCQISQFLDRELNPGLSGESAISCHLDYRGQKKQKEQKHKEKEGIIICAGGEKYLSELVVLLTALNKDNCKYPIVICHADNEITNFQKEFILSNFNNKNDNKNENKNISFLNLDDKIREDIELNNIIQEINDKNSNKFTLRGWHIKQFALYFSPFEKTIILDTDIIPINNVNNYFNDYLNERTDFFIFSDYWRHYKRNTKEYCMTDHLRPVKDRQDIQSWIIYNWTGSFPFNELEGESGVIIFNNEKNKHQKVLDLLLVYALYNPILNNYFYGDKDIYKLAFDKIYGCNNTEKNKNNRFRQSQYYPGAIASKDKDIKGMVQWKNEKEPNHLHFTLKPISGTNSASLLSIDNYYICKLDDTKNNIAKVVVENDNYAINEHTYNLDTNSYKSLKFTFTENPVLIYEFPSEKYDVLVEAFEKSRELYLKGLFFNF